MSVKQRGILMKVFLELQYGYFMEEYWIGKLIIYTSDQYKPYKEFFQEFLKKDYFFNTHHRSVQSFVTNVYKVIKNLPNGKRTLEYTV